MNFCRYRSEPGDEADVEHVIQGRTMYASGETLLMCALDT